MKALQRSEATLRIFLSAAALAGILLALLSCDSATATVGNQEDLTGDAFFEDGFENYSVGSVVDGNGANGFVWSGHHDGVYVTDEISHTGAKSLKAEYGPTNPGTNEPDHWWGEQNFQLGRTLDEIWVEFHVYFPDGNEGLGSARYERFLAQPTKMISIWGDDYNNSSYAVFQLWGSADGDAAVNVNVSETYPGQNHDLVTNGSRAAWLHWRQHVRTSSSPGVPDGAVAFWVDGRLLERLERIVVEPRSTGSMDWRQGYVFGYDNEHFSQETYVYIDDIRFYDQDPGW